MKDENCPDCSRFTSGDCGKHSGTWFETRSDEDRLKTLEDKVEFIMGRVIKNPDEDKEYRVSLGNFSQTIKYPTLQDLWDEKKGIVRASEYNKAVNIPSCDGTSCNNRDFNFTNGDNGEPTDKSEKNVRVLTPEEVKRNEEPTDKSEKIEDIIKELEYYIANSPIKSWLRDKLKKL